MRKLNLWIIPAAFFALCCALNLAGCAWSETLERIIKPSLMPLLSLATFTYLLEAAGLRSGDLETCHPRHRKREGPTQWEGSRSDSPALRGAGLLMLGQMFGFAGDTMLLGKGFPFFAGGIGLFLIGHICYICLFGGRSWKGLKAWHWAVAMVICCAMVACLIGAIGINGAMLVPMAVYGFVLTLLMFSTLAGALRFGGLIWWMLFAGAMLFTFSDALIAVHNFHPLSPFMRGPVVMATYLAAQTLLAVGGVRLLLSTRPSGKPQDQESRGN
jgi:uncharacterized membrane protein YhhN